MTPPRKEGNTVAVSKAQQKAVTKYVKNKYDRFGLTMPKGDLDAIKAHAEARGGECQRLYQPRREGGHEKGKWRLAIQKPP